uniref:Golgin B1 n=1 Tax=Oryzias latipes TaxID=8090 RepID=A0A3P9K9H3_ORYLA
MLKWFSGEEGEPGSGGPGSPRSAAGGAPVAVEEVAERLAQTERLVTQLKEMIREKDAALRSKDEQLKVEKEACEAKLSKLRLQSKAKVTSLTAQLEELKRRGDPASPAHNKKASSEGAEHASRGKIVLLKKKVEELEQQLAHRDQDLENQRKEMEALLQRGEEMDAMLTDKEKRLEEKEAYIVHLQTGLSGEKLGPPAPEPRLAEGGNRGAMEELQLLVQSLTRKVGEAEERYSLLQEQTDGLRALLTSEQEQYSQKESMYKQNIQTFKDIILQKDNQLTEINQMHEQELFKLAAKSDASADLEQLLKALKQKLHEKEEVLLGKTQVIDVLQGEVDSRDQHVKELTERLRRLQVERESLESKMEAEKHVMRAQLRDLMEKQQMEVRRLTEQHNAQMDQIQQDLLGQLQDLKRASAAAEAPRQDAADPASLQRLAELEAQAKQKTEEASKSDTKFLKMKAWSKSRIRQLEEELKKSQAGAAPPDLMSLRSRITTLEEEREEMQWKVEQYEELKAQNGMLEAKLVLYEEQQRTLQAELEQFTKRAASQASESGSADDTQSQVLEWQEMVAEAISAKDRAREEKVAMALRISHMEEEREALTTRQQELEEELAHSRGLGQHGAKKLAAPSQRSLQEDFQFDGQTPCLDAQSPSESTPPTEGENMGGWWPEYSTPDTGGLRSVVEELELERNQLQEQILSLEEHCQDLEDRLQLQARIEALQHESEKLQTQLASVRSQQSREAEKHQLQVNSLTEQLKRLSDTQEILETSLMEKENTLAETSEKLELINSLKDSLMERELQCKELSEKLLHAEQDLENVFNKHSSSEKQCCELKAEVVELLQKQSALKEKVQKQDAIIEALQAELDQTNEELDKLNTTHLEERAQLIHDLQSCEREMDALKDALSEKDKEISGLAGSMAEYAEQLSALKQDIRVKEESLVRLESALKQTEQETRVLRESQSSDQQTLNSRITELVGKLQDAEAELLKTKEERERKEAEMEQLMKQAQEDKKTIQSLQGEIQKEVINHRHHLSECETQISSLKEQLSQKVQDSEELVAQLRGTNVNAEKLQQEMKEKEEAHTTELKALKEEQNKLLAQMEAYSREVQLLSQQLEQQKQSEENTSLLEEKLKTSEKRSEEERKAFSTELRSRESEKERLSEELRTKTDTISELKSLSHRLVAEKHRTEEMLKELNEELDLQKLRVKDLDGQISSALQLNSSLESRVGLLTEQNQRLQVEAEERAEERARDVTAEVDARLAKVVDLEKLQSENNKIIQELQRDKEELTVQANQLKQALEQNSHADSQVLQAKTKECDHLNQVLKDREEKLVQLQDHVQNLSGTVERLQLSLAEKEQTAAETQQKLETLQLQQSQLEETLSLLRERESSLQNALKQQEERLHEREEALRSAQQQCQLHKEQLNERNESLKAAKNQFGALQEHAGQLESEAEEKTMELSALRSSIQAATEENRQLHAARQAQEMQLSQQKQAVSDLTEQLGAALKQTSTVSLQLGCLREDNQRLQQELAANISSLSELRQKAESSSADLLEKTNDCANLTQRLRDKEEQLLSLQEQVGQLNAALKDKDTTVSEQRTQLEVLQQQLLQHEDTASMLQQQVAVLKAGLMEKEAKLQQISEEQSAHQTESVLQKELTSKMQEEVEALRRRCSEVSRQMELKEQALGQVTKELQNHKDELNKRNESVVSLSTQLGAMNQSSAELEAEISRLDASVQKLSAENLQLVQKEEQTRAEMTEFKDHIQALNQQNAGFKSELQSMALKLTDAGQLLTQHQAEVQHREDQLREKAEALKQQEHLIQQLHAALAEQAEQLRRAADEDVRLQKLNAELEDSVCRLRGEVDRLEQKERLSLQHQSQSSATVEHLNSWLEAKETECLSLKEQTLHLEESVTKLKNLLQAQECEAQSLKKTLQEKETELLEQTKTLEDVQRRADEALILKTQLKESTEMVLQLQEQVQGFSAEITNLRESADKTQSAFSHQRDENHVQLEDMREQLAERSREASSLRALLDEASSELQAAEATIRTLTNQLSEIRNKLRDAEASNASLSQEKEEAFASHRSSVSQLTVEIEELRSQHLQVVAQMNALTENLEQREMALHAINSQFTAQAKNTSQLLLEMQKLQEQNKKLSAELSLSKEEQQRLQASLSDRNLHLRREVEKLQAQVEQGTSSMKETESEKMSLQAQVSAKDEELCGLRENMQKLEQVLQDSEKEWLLVLEREQLEKSLLTEQLQAVENQMRAENVNVNALKQDLDCLQERLEEASAAVRQGSDLLSAKEAEAAASRAQLHRVLASMQEEERQKRSLQQTLTAVQQDLTGLLSGRGGADEPPSCSESSATAALQDLIRRVQAAHQAEKDALRRELAETCSRLQEAQTGLNEGAENLQQIPHLRETAERLRAQLDAEAEKAKDVSAKLSSVKAELKAKEDHISCMTLQSSQQKELLAALTQQLKDKDASIAQVIAAAANERMKLEEDNRSLQGQLQSVEQAHRASVQRLEEQVSHSQREAESRNTEKTELMKEKEDLQSQLAKVSKDKEVTKKKLQAALVVRKDLLKRIDEYEKQKEERNEAAAQMMEEKLSALERRVEQKEEEASESSRLVERLMLEKRSALNERDSIIERLQSSVDVALEEKTCLQRRLEELQREIKTCKEELAERSSCALACADLENELERIKLEKASLQKKAQAALLARKEAMKKAQESEKRLIQELADLKDDYKSLLEQRCQQTNELNTVQLNLDEKVKELAELHKTFASHQEEQDSLKRLLEEKDKVLQELQLSLADREKQNPSASDLQTELDAVRVRLQSVCLDVERKDGALRCLKSELHTVQTDLEKCRAEIQKKTEEMEKSEESLRAVHLTEIQALLHQKTAALEQLNICQQHAEADQAALLGQTHQLKEERDAALASVLQKSAEVSTLKGLLAEAQKQLDEELEGRTEAQTKMDSLLQQNEDSLRLISELRHEVFSLREAENRDGPCPSCKNTEDQAKQKDEALLASQAQALEKEQLIAALEQQLQQQTKMQELTAKTMKADAEGLQKSAEDDIRTNEQDNRNKMALLAKKLQAALVSRKELMQESVGLKEKLETLRADVKTKEAKCLDLESAVWKLRQQNAGLENSVASVMSERDKLSTEVHGILNENCSLSAACDSLKLTIESITQQKRAFSCQLESLKDSQTEELSKWKSKHAELKQEYDSLLRDYQNLGAEVQALEKQGREAAEENQRAKEEMHELTREKQQRTEELHQENQKIREQLSVIDGNHKTTINQLLNKNQQLEAELNQLRGSSADLGRKLAEMEAKNHQLNQSLQESSRLLEEESSKSDSYARNMQFKLDEALGLNNSLTAQMEAQKTEHGAQLDINKVLQKEKQDFLEKMEKMQRDHELQLAGKEGSIKELRERINAHEQETISLNEKVRILEDDKSLLQEELENTQDISDKVKNENEYLETVILKNSEKIDQLTESVGTLQAQNAQTSAQLAAMKETCERLRQEKERQQLQMVQEFEEKVKSVQRGNQGSKSTTRELQELLKDKHQEINQLQQNCIQYQEVILDLERALKNSQSAQELLEKDLKRSSDRMSVLEEKAAEVEAELKANQKLLREADEKIEEMLSERNQLALGASQQEEQPKNHTAQGSKSPESDGDPNSYVEIQLQNQIEQLQTLKDEDMQQVEELVKQLDSKDLQINSLRRAAETNQAKLLALSSSPQGAEATRLWNELYLKSLHDKDCQLLEQGSTISRFLEDLRGRDRQVDDLQMTKARLERSLGEYSVAAAAQQRQLLVVSATNAELSQATETMAAKLTELRAQLERLEREKSFLSRQLSDQEDAVSQLQLQLQQTEKMKADADTQLLHFQAQHDRVQAELEKQEGISLHLKALLKGKDAEISSLLSCRDGQMSGYLEQLQENYRSQASVYEDRLDSAALLKEQARKESRALEAKVKSLQTQLSRAVGEKEQMAAKVKALKDSMSSLQSDRERLVSENRTLQTKTLSEGRDGSAEADPSKGLKHEIRKLLHQMDDLNSENAMLRAQLVRYREDLNQVLSLKDNQVKVLLKKQLDVIRTLEQQKTAAEKQHREAQLELQKEEEAGGALQALNSRLKAHVAKLEADLQAQKDQLTVTDEARVIADLQASVAAKAADCNNLQQQLSSQKVLTEELQEKILLLEKEALRKLAEAERRNENELNTLGREAGLMRNERETAARRVAELSKELLHAEQLLSEAQGQSKDAAAQKQALCKAMAALQNDRDQLIQDFKILRNRYDEELREARAALNKAELRLNEVSSDLAVLTKDRDILAYKLKAVESKDPPGELGRLLDEVSKALSEKEGELKRAVLENAAFSRQLSAFSKSMASLQNDRDRLMDELHGAKRAVELRQKSSPEAGLTPSAEKAAADRVQESEEAGPEGELGSELQQEVHHQVTSNQEDPADLRSEAGRRRGLQVQQKAVAFSGQSETADVVSRLEAERMQLHKDLQRCIYEVHQRDQYLQQLDIKLQQTVEEKASVSVQLRAVSQTLRETQNHCQRLENQIQGRAQSPVYVEVAPGAPQEKSNHSPLRDSPEASQLRERLVEVEQILAEERGRRESAEEALRLHEHRLKSAGASLLRDAQRDFSIEVEAEDEWDALTINPNQPLIAQKVTGGMVACRRWIRGRSLYFSRLLTSRARSRHFFLAYLLMIHLLVLMCLTGAL